MKKFTIFWWFVGWKNLAFGISISLENPDIEIHLPFGFVTIGWQNWSEGQATNWEQVKQRYFKIW